MNNENIANIYLTQIVLGHTRIALQRTKYLFIIKNTHP